MTRYIPVSRSQHQHMSWHSYPDYRFAAQTAVAPIVAAELAKATMALPIAFMAEGNGYVPVAILSIEPERNLFIGPDGRWLGTYVPAVFRGHPFRILPDQNGKLTLAVDAESGLIVDSAEGGKPFFGVDEQLAPDTARIFEFLKKTESNRAATARACAALKATGVIVPWEIKVKDEDSEKTIAGMHKIDEKALNALSSEALVSLHNAGALPIAYCQMLSMQHLSVLGKLVQAHAQRVKKMEDLMPQLTGGPEEPEMDIDWNAFAADTGNKD